VDIFALLGKIRWQSVGNLVEWNECEGMVGRRVDGNLLATWWSRMNVRDWLGEEWNGLFL